MKVKVTLVLSALVLAALALGLMPAQAATILTTACVQVESQQPAMSAPALFSDPQPARSSVEQATTAQDCLSFCSRVLCTEGNVCGPCPNGGCGCQPSGGV
jgi:hypothetical protein